jgi:hypothetical protein
MENMATTPSNVGRSIWYYVTNRNGEVEPRPGIFVKSIDGTHANLEVFSNGVADGVDPRFVDPRHHVESARFDTSDTPVAGTWRWAVILTT